MRFEEDGIVSYTGDLASNKAERIESVKDLAKQIGDEAYLDVDVHRAALNAGTTTANRQAIRNGFQAIYDRAVSLIQQINACDTLDEVWNVDIQFNNLSTAFVPEAGWNLIKKSANQSVTNSASLVTDSELTFPMLANTKYAVRGMIFWDTTATGDFKYTIQGPANPTGVRLSMLTGAAGAVPALATVTTAYPSSAGVSLAGTGTNGMHSFDMVIHNGNTAGDFLFRFAQNTATAAQSATVIAGSYIEYFVA